MEKATTKDDPASMHQIELLLGKSLDRKTIAIIERLTDARQSEIDHRILEVIHRLINDVALNKRTLNEALRLMMKGRGARLTRKLASASRGVYRGLEGGPEWFDSAYNNRMASLIAAILLLLEEEENFQKIGHYPKR